MNLGSVDARRAAFAALAFATGWKKARIGRYLNISRARVGQRIKKYQQYAESGNWPVLAEVIANPKEPDVGIEASALQITLDAEVWENQIIADTLLNRLV